jgi:hypothetical protein
MIYFGYCTYLDVSEMRKSFPTAKKVGVGRLHGYRLGFASYGSLHGQGGCTLEEAPGHEVLGLMFEVDLEELGAMDESAGVDKGWYDRIEITALNEHGDELPATTYVISNPTGPFCPSSTYAKPILLGARALQLPGDYVRELEQIIMSAQQPAAAE